MARFLHALRPPRPVHGPFWTLPNAISLSRVPLAVVAMIFHALGDPIAALVVLCIAFLTDVADGMVARARQQFSEWGRILDPLADKIAFLIVAAVLVATHRLPLWFLVLLVARDVLLVIGAVTFTRRVDRVPSSNIAGKISSTLLGLTMVRCMLWPVTAGVLGLDALGWLAVAALVVSTIVYARRLRFPDVHQDSTATAG